MERIHIIGIAGVGMSATALLLKEAGWHVSGSDAECYGPPRDILEKAGIAFKGAPGPKGFVVAELEAKLVALLKAGKKP